MNAGFEHCYRKHQNKVVLVPNLMIFNFSEILVFSKIWHRLKFGYSLFLSKFTLNVPKSGHFTPKFKSF